MSTIVTRSGKGSPLTNTEVDSNFSNLNTDKAELSGAAFTGAITTNSTFDGRDVATDGTKLDGIEASADVTDTANVTAAGALMDSELTSIASVKALNQGVATGDSPTFAALTSTGEITANGGIALGDNDFLTFGASDDLRIYHQPADDSSYIRELGAGNLKILGDNVQILNAAGTENQIFSASDGGVTLYHNGSAKIASTATGIDVTGTATMDGLVVAGNISSTQGGSVGAPKFTLSGSTTTGLYTPAADTLGVSIAGTERMRVLSTGIDVTGTATMDGLSVNGTQNSKVVYFDDSSEAGSRQLQFTSSTNGQFWDINSQGTSGGLGGELTLSTRSIDRLNIDTGGDISFYEDTGTTAKFFWDASAERLGLGTASPQRSLHMAIGTENTAIRVETTDTESGLEFIDPAGTAYFRASGDYIKMGATQSDSLTILAGGNVLVGVASAGADGGVTLSTTGYIQARIDNDTVAYFDRTGAGDDGEIVRLQQNGTTVGSIGTVGGVLTIGNGDTGLLFSGSGDYITPRNPTTQAGRDAAIDLGTGSDRFKDLYLSGGVYLGGTGAANRLDHYEEISWTPTQSGVTLSVTKAQAIRVGNLVTVNARITWPSNSNSTTIAIAGIPFVRSSTWEDVSIVMANYATLDSNRPQLQAYLGGSTINIYKTGSGQSWVALNNAALSGAEIIFTLSYLTT